MGPREEDSFPNSWPRFAAAAAILNITVSAGIFVAIGAVLASSPFIGPAGASPCFALSALIVVFFGRFLRRMRAAPETISISWGRIALRYRDREQVVDPSHTTEILSSTRRRRHCVVTFVRRQGGPIVARDINREIAERLLRFQVARTRSFVPPSVEHHLPFVGEPRQAPPPQLKHAPPWATTVAPGAKSPRPDVALDKSGQDTPPVGWWCSWLSVTPRPAFFRTVVAMVILNLGASALTFITTRNGAAAALVAVTSHTALSALIEADRKRSRAFRAQNEAGTSTLGLGMGDALSAAIRIREIMPTLCPKCRERAPLTQYHEVARWASPGDALRIVVFRANKQRRAEVLVESQLNDGRAPRVKGEIEAALFPTQVARLAPA